MNTIRNPRVAVIGASDAELAQIKIILSNKNIELVDPEDADATVEPNWVLSAIKSHKEIDLLEVNACDERATKYGVKVVFIGDPCQLNPVKEGPSRVFVGQECSYDDGKQHWRGGSRGKGGKIKYRRS